MSSAFLPVIPQVFAASVDSSNDSTTIIGFGFLHFFQKPIPTAIPTATTSPATTRTDNRAASLKKPVSFAQNPCLGAFAWICFAIALTEGTRAALLQTEKKPDLWSTGKISCRALRR